MSKLQTKQNSLLKYLTKRDRLYPTNNIHLENNILKVKDQYELKLATFVHDCLNLNTIPLFYNYFTPKHSTHQYQTRHNLLQIPANNNNSGYSSIESTAARKWNANPIARKYLHQSKNTMKKHLTNYFVNAYSST